MQVTELESNGLKKHYRIVVEAASLNEQMEAELKRAGERVRIPGFRPGYIPMKILKQRYGQSVQADVIKHAINHATTDVVTQNKLRPAITPQINVEDYKEDGDLVFTMACELFPEIKDLHFDAMTLERGVFEIAEQDIDEAQERIAERSPAFTRLKEGAKAAEGHVVTIDFIGKIDGVAFKGGAAQDFRLELGGGQFIEGFEEQLIGAKEGEQRVVNVTFPKDYPSEDIAGKDAAFDVTVKEIHEMETPAIDEAFAKARGFADLAALREAIRKQMTREYDQIVRNQLKKQLFDLMDEKFDCELPPSMVEMEFNSIWERLKQAQAQGDESVAGKDEAELKKEYGDIARRRVKLGLLLAEVGNRHKIQITREELSQAAMQQASLFPGQERKVLEFYRSHPERIEDLRGPLLEEKAVDHILGMVTFKERKVTLKELEESDMAEEEDSDSSGKPAKGKSTRKEGKKVASKKKASGNKE